MSITRRLSLLAVGFTMSILAACSNTNQGGGSSSGDPGSSSSSGGGSSGPVSGDVGAPCARNADCNSSLCLASGRCSRACTTTGDCPASWACDAVAGAGTLCACTPDSSATETCDGMDNNWDAQVDEGATCADGLFCQGGQCPPERSCNGDCVDLQSNAQHCGMCGRACQANQACPNGQCVTDV